MNIEKAKKFIEDELRYSFSSMDTKSIANKLLFAYTKGYEDSLNDFKLIEDHSKPIDVNEYFKE